MRLKHAVSLASSASGERAGHGWSGHVMLIVGNKFCSVLECRCHLCFNIIHVQLDAHNVSPMRGPDDL